MIISFRDQATEDVFNGINSKDARKACPRTLLQIASRKLDQIDSAQSLDDLKVPPVIGLRRFLVTGKANIAFASMNNIASALCGTHQVHATSK